MRIIRLAVFGSVGLALVLIGLALAIGWRPFGSPPTPVAPPTEALPTGIPEPTLTADERTTANMMNTRAESMVAAATDLQQLGQEIRATAAWKGKVHTAASIITGGQKTIQQAALPARFGPLTTRAKVVTDGCGAAVESLPDSDGLTIATVAAIRPQLEQCARDLKRLQLSLSGL